MTKASWEGKMYIPAHSIPEGSQDRNLEVGTQAETMEEFCLLAALHGLLNLFLYHLGPPAQR